MGRSYDITGYFKIDFLLFFKSSDEIIDPPFDFTSLTSNVYVYTRSFSLKIHVIIFTFQTHARISKT